MELHSDYPGNIEIYLDSFHIIFLELKMPHGSVYLFDLDLQQIIYSRINNMTPGIFIKADITIFIF